MSMKTKKQLEKTEQEIQRLEREVETLRDSKPPSDACKAFVIAAQRRARRLPGPAPRSRPAGAHSTPTNRPGPAPLSM